jgi:superfamily II DNA or RNA helicase
MQLRPYQTAAVDAARRELALHRSTLIVMPTGTGKTVVFADVLERVVARGGRALVLAHRNELLEQAAAKLGVDCAIEKGRMRAGAAAVVVASVQSLKGKRLAGFDPATFRLIVVDEAHHARAKSYRAILDYFTTAKVLGVTATPDRADGKGLAEVFDTVAYRYELRDAINDEWLVPLTAKRIEVEGLDLSSVRTTCGDLNAKDLAAVMGAEQALHEVASPLLELAGDRKTVLFTVDVAHARALAEVINRHRPGTARPLDGTASADERRAVLRDFRAGAFRVLANCALLTEGWDEPSVECVAIARPTKSRALYVQMIGRGTRLHADKSDVLILDFVGNSGRHRLINPAHALAGADVDDELAELAHRTASDTGVSVERALQEAQLELEVTRQRAAIVARAKFFAEEIDPWMPRRAPATSEREGRPATERQLELLQRKGIEPPVEISIGDASGIIDGLRAREEAGLCTYKQARLLRRQGLRDAFTFSKQYASGLIGELRKQWAERAERAKGFPGREPEPQTKPVPGFPNTEAA